ncbi:MAG TPA: cellulase family glycosylhydrolase [Acidobacteriaceae bacterium]|jgi:aryl-phospho-beta-D-glucosidase BglC (GH1 family)
MRIVSTVLASLLLSSCVVAAQQPPASLAAERAHLLHRGVNASMWFAQARDYSPARLRSYTTADDIALMHSVGFDHVRLSIDGDELVRGAPPNGLNAAFVAELDSAVNTMLKDGLRVIVDVHPSDEFKRRLRTDDAAVTQFCALWSALASHYAQTDPERVFFEILNEPEFDNAQQWAAVEARAAAAIRQAAPHHTIIATAQHYSGLTDLLTLAPLADPNVIYTFHDYEPFPFTHQGATWTMDAVQPLRHVPYPSTPENIAQAVSEEPQLIGQHWVNAYGLDRWDAARIRSELSFAGKWAALHHVPVYCGEFGVYQPYADPGMRAAWLHDTRTALEAQGIGWAVWDYQGSFAVVTKTNGKAAPIPAITDALGLHPQ